jgi:hypothetical protein
MRTFANILTIGAFWVLLVAPASAGDTGLSERFNASWVVPYGTTADYLQSGYGIAGGVDWRPGRGGPLVLQADLAWSRLNAKQRLVDLGQAQSPGSQIDDGRANTWQLTGGAKFEIPFAGGTKGYVVAAAGAYRVEVQLTETVLIGGAYCDYWGFCYVGVVPGQVVAASSSTTKFGWNAGVGVEFPLGYGQSWYVEARYHRIETPNPVEFIPITVGWRF